MIDLVKKFFSKTGQESSSSQGEETAHDVRVATCALMVEMAQADDDFSEIEKDRISDILCEHYGLSESHARELMEAAQEELSESVHLWRFTHLINENYSNEEKLKVIEMVWRVIYADGKLDKYEDYLVHRLAKLLNLTHRQLIDAKVRVLRETPPG